MGRGFRSVLQVAIGVPAAVLAARSAAGQPARQSPLSPRVVLQANESTQAEAPQGTPLVFTVRLSNARATNTAAANAAKQRRAEVIREKVSRGELSAEEAQPALDVARQAEPVEVVRVGTSERGWQAFLHFERRMAGGRSEPLAWALKPVAAPARGDLTLDGSAIGELDFSLPPEAAAGIDAGTYEIVAVFQVSDGDDLPAGHWRGRAESAPVRVTFTPPVSPADPAAAVAADLQRLWFFAKARDWPNAAQSADRILAASPLSLRAQIILAEAKEAQGDRDGALAAYLKAFRLFDELHPDAQEPPDYLILKIASLSERLPRP